MYFGAQVRTRVVIYADSTRPTQQLAGLPEALKLVLQHFANPSISVSSSALRVSQNSGEELFYGKKHKVEKVRLRRHRSRECVPSGSDHIATSQVFEDDGNMASGVTSAVWDSERRNLYLHGKFSTRRFHHLH